LPHLQSEIPDPAQTFSSKNKNQKLIKVQALSDPNPFQTYNPPWAKLQTLPYNQLVLCQRVEVPVVLRLQQTLILYPVWAILNPQFPSTLYFYQSNKTKVELQCYLGIPSLIKGIQ